MIFKYGFINVYHHLSKFPLRVCLVRELGGEGREGKGRDFNGGEIF